MSGLQVSAVAEPLTPHNSALYEAGKKLLVDSVEVGRDFCKFMIGVATSAIPLYLSLVALVVGKDYRPNLGPGLMLLVPAVLFLASTIVFAVGYFPVRTKFSLDLPGEIDAVRSQTMDRRYRLSLVGFSLFAVGVLIALAVVASLLTRPS